MGEQYFDLDDKIQGKNHKTGERVDLKFVPRDKNGRSTIKGQCFDSRGTLVYELTGSWADQIQLINVQTKESETIWTENLELIP